MPPRTRKRVRRRRPVNQVNDISSSSSSSSSDSNSDNEKSVVAPVRGNKEDIQMKNPTSESSSSPSSSSSDHSASYKPVHPEQAHSTQSSSDESDSDSEPSQAKAPAKRGRLAKKQRNLNSAVNPISDAHSTPTPRSPSPIPASPPPPLPDTYFDLDLSIPYLDHPPAFDLPFNPSSSSKHTQTLNAVTAKLAESEADFRTWYMSTVVDRFENELDVVRKDLEKSRGSKTQTKFELLLAGLASGADVFEDFHHPLGFSSHHETSQSATISQPSKQSEKELVMETLKMQKFQNQDHIHPSEESTDTDDVEMQT
ncbi:hypothetical protein CROQUDRAFT_670226 [Cronartium quercuum f. sp. fusiforme G11]|uniref:Ribosome assembly protein 3 n=1 Tax=Cronartium quercuum f. sp. fusiforme G11 TaxID=708437 RepID=A0A9P6NPJ5_9BASI|nr:hypothetical protein CROQUDRAFT_670226 [Cronartium quercuum f. sp. fusiforme G11]